MKKSIAILLILTLICAMLPGCAEELPQVDLAQMAVALMDQYMPTLRMTGLSGSPVKSVTVQVLKAGKLTLSTVCVADIEKSDAKTTVLGSYEVSEGENRLQLDVTLADSDTLLLGAPGDTAVLAGAEKGMAYTALGAPVGSSLQQLQLLVDYGSQKQVLASVLEGFEAYLQGKDYFRVMEPAYGPYGHNDWKLYENTQVQYLNAYIKSVSALDDSQYLTVHVANIDDLSIVSSHKFYAKAAELGSDAAAVDRLIRLTPAESISVGAGQTLLFTAAEDPMKCGYNASCKDSKYLGFYYGPALENHDYLGCLGLDVVVKAGKVFNHTIHVAKLQAMEKEADQAMQLMRALSGKGISFIGDSISSYEGWSNNTEYNDTIGNNAVFYTPGILPLEETYWQQLMARGDMELVVNNAWSGSRVFATDASAGWDIRCENLHNNAGRKPDIVVVYFGINDLNGNVPFNTDFSNAFYAQVESEGFMPISFDEAYALMIHKIRKNYPDADVFCCTFPDNTITASSMNVKYNTVIKNIASHYKANIVDFYGTELSKSFGDYTIDGLHPNAEGMDIMTDTILEAMKKVYCKN